MRIDSNFHGGNIDVADANDTANVQLKIRYDPGTTYAQWFYFRVLGAAGENCRFRIINGGEASYPEAWPGSTIVYSADRKLWRRSETTFDGEELSFKLHCHTNSLYIALSPPFSEDQHHDLIADALASEHCALHAVIPTIEDRTIEVLRVGTTADSTPKIWVLARQHPGEPMAEWYVKGLLERLLDPLDVIAQRLRGAADIYIVPNMNPDGVAKGNLRTNAAGVDLNRAWAAPNVASAPEVFGVLREMQRTGVDMFLDIHGDEEFPFVFAAGCEGNPGFTADQAEADARIRDLYQRSNPDFSVENGYETDAPGNADLSIACNQIGERFGCPSLTIEMPFKDNAKQPDPIEGWGIARSEALGVSLVEVLVAYYCG